MTRNQTYAFLSGLITGAVVAAIYAPHSGAATRQRLREAVDEAGDSISEAGKYLRSQAERFNAEAQATIAHTQTQVHEVFEQAGVALNVTLKQASEAFAANAGNASSAIKTAISTATGQTLR